MNNKGGIQQELSQNRTLLRYRSTVIGNKGITSFLLYEIVTTLINPFPGVLGNWARQMFLPLLFSHFGAKTVFHRNVSFRRPHLIRIGRNVILESGVTLDVKSDDGYIEIQDNVRVGNNSILSCLGGKMVVGHGTRIGTYCRLGSLKGLIIGEHVKVDHSTCIVGAGHEHHSRDLPIARQPLTCKGSTIIDDHVVIEKEVTLLDGVHIGEGVRIKAGSLVNSDISSNCIVMGVPAVAV